MPRAGSGASRAANIVRARRGSLVKAEACRGASAMPVTQGPTRAPVGI